MRALPLLMVAAAMLGLPMPASAVEDGSQLLPALVYVALTGDVDGDGAKEIVRVVDDAANRGLELQAWSHDGEDWVTRSVGPLVYRDDDGSQARVNPGRDGFGLLASHVDGRERVLLVTGGGIMRNETGAFHGCCLSVFAVEGSNGDLVMRPLLGAGGAVESVTLLDADDDGTDELLVLEPVDEEGERSARLLRWDGERFAADRAVLPLLDDFVMNIIVGDSDGVPGDDAMLGHDPAGRLVRVTASPGSLDVETAYLGGAIPPGEAGRWPIGAVGGSLVTVGADGLHVIDWPRGGAATSVASDSSVGFSIVHLLGEGGDALIAEWEGSGISGWDFPPVRIRDLDLRHVADAIPSPAAARFSNLPAHQMPALRNLAHALFPYLGPIPGGLGDGKPAVFSAGNLLTLDDAGGIAVSPSSTVTGVLPLGVAGEGGEWMVFSDGWAGDRDRAYFFSFGGPSATIRVAPTATVLAPEPDDGRLTPQLHAAWMARDADGHPRLLTGPDGFQATVTVPAGSTVAAAVDQQIVFEQSVGGGAQTVTLRPARARDQNQPFDAAMIVLTPAGHAYSAFWQAEILREPPELSVKAVTDPFRASATLSGAVSEYASLTVDGEPVGLTDGGEYSVQVEASLWPRMLRVVARDPVGNETVESLSVVGVFDYRGLPWVPIVATVTALLGALLFMRTPRRAAAPDAAPDGARLEELGEDDEKYGVVGPS